MTTQEFQEKLSQLVSLAGSQGQCVASEQVADFFQKEELNREQMLRLLQYLREKGIKILIDPSSGSETGSGSGKVSESVLPGTRRALSEEERRSLEEYRARIREAGGEMEEFYLLAAGLAEELNCEELPFMDLLQEANLSLLTIMEESGADHLTVSQVREFLQPEMVKIIESFTNRKAGDNELVSKVEKLDQALKELVDEEDGGKLNFSIEELAILLDTTVDDIRDILRLTGEE